MDPLFEELIAGAVTMTVLGVIIAFQQLGDAAKNPGAMGNVMAGIAEALIATGVGIFVAIPAVVAYNLLQKKIAEIESSSISLAKLITAHAKSRPIAAPPPHLTNGHASAEVSISVAEA